MSVQSNIDEEKKSVPKEKLTGLISLYAAQSQSRRIFCWKHFQERQKYAQNNSPEQTLKKMLPPKVQEAFNPWIMVTRQIFFLAY